MNKVTTKRTLLSKIASIFLAGFTLTLLLGFFFWCYSVLSAVFMIDELADQIVNNKQVIAPQTAGSRNMVKLPQPGETAANHNSNDSAEISGTAKNSTFNGGTSENYKSGGTAGRYQQITANQQQTKEANLGQTVSSNSNDTSETQAAAPANSVADPNIQDMYNRVARLEFEIERLTDRIDSGLSDTDYDHYANLPSPIFVIHDKERLELYQSMVDKMLQDMTHL